MLENVIQMKSEHLIHMKARSESLTVKDEVSVSNCNARKCDNMQYEDLIHMKTKSERLICRKRNLNV